MKRTIIDRISIPSGGWLAGTAILFAVAIVPAMAHAAGESGDGKANISTIRQACKNDFDRLCKGVKPGGGRIIACLKDHASDLSLACRQALSETGMPQNPPKSTAR